MNEKTVTPDELERKAQQALVLAIAIGQLLGAGQSLPLPKGGR